MFTLIKTELYKIFQKPRTYISFIAIAVVVILIQLALISDGPTWVKLLLSSLTAMFDIDEKTVLNGYLICFLILNTLLIQVPLLVALVTGDLIAGEANMGTLRLLATKPYSRTQIITAKFLAGLFYTFLLLIWMAILALFLSMAIFGTNDLLNSKSGIVIIINGDDVFWRYLCAFGYAFIALAAVAALSFMLSVFSENSIGPIVATMSIIIVCTIISTMDLPLFSKINPLLFTTHMTGWKGFFNTKSTDELGGIPGTIYNLPTILKSAGILVAHIFIFFGIALYGFRKKDILS